MIRVAVSGAGGKLAGAIISAVAAADDLDLAALYNPSREGVQIEGREIAGAHDQIEADVVLEAADPDGARANLDVWQELGLATVVGTSGFTKDRLESLRDMWGTRTPCLVVPNFAIGAVLMMRFASEAASRFEATEIIERHGVAKPDAPSGTSLASAMRISESGGSSGGSPDELVTGARGADVEGVRVHSLRLPGLISHQEVAMSNPGEMLSITHQSSSYDSFAAGALLAIREVQSLPGGVHVGLETVL